MIRELLLFLACVGSLGVSRGNDEQSKEPACEDAGPDDIYLDLSDMELQRISKPMVSSSKITCLNLAENQIGSISSDAFDGLPELRYLNFAGNPVPPNEFAQTKLPTLKTLVLDGPIPDRNNNYRGQYDQDFGNIFSFSMPELEKLSLQDYEENDEHIVLHWLQGFKVPNLTHLYLSGNTRLGGELSNILSNMNNLTHLYLDRTQVDYLDRTSLSNLRHLSMNGNNIRSIGAGYYSSYDNSGVPRGMYNLEYLSLAYNEIANVSSNFFATSPNLRFLNLAVNAIDNFPLQTSMDLVNLRNLTLDNNKLSRVPEMCGLKALRYLSLNENNIVSVNVQSFCNMQNLSEIYLRRNGLSNIDDETFGHLPALVVLDLSYNNIVSLPENWIYPKNFIAELHLDSNKFIDIDSMSLKGVGGLQCLSFGHNPLKMVTILSLMDLPNSTRFDVSREPASGPLPSYGWPIPVR